MSELFEFINDSSMNIVDGCLVLTLPQVIDENILNSITQSLLNKISQHKLLGVVIDFGAIDIMDSFEFNKMKKTVDMVKIMGLDVVLVGLKPGMVSALIDLNVDTSDLTTFLNLDVGLEYLQRKKSVRYEDEQINEELVEHDSDEDRNEVT